MEPKDEALYRLGLALGRAEAHTKYWKQAVADARAFGRGPGLVRARKAGHAEEQAKIYAEGYAQALQECRAADFYYEYREQIDEYAQSYAVEYVMRGRSTLHCENRKDNEEEV